MSYVLCCTLASGVFQRTCNAMQGYVFREHSSAFYLCGIQRDLEAGESGNEVKVPLPRGILGDSWI